jgi:aspartyl-tRNA(Asn)/glutamyl-tRNA(Gln) amidotransferase subunit A
MGRVESAVWANYLQTIEKLKQSGFELEGISVEGFDACPYVCVSVVYPEVASAHHELLRASPNLYEADIRALISVGELWSARMYLDAQRIRSVLRTRFERIMKPYDALLTPTVPVQPPRFGDKPRVEGDPPGSPLYTMIRFTVPFNVMSCPAISVPMGLDSEGLPAGLQVVGKPGQDASLLGMALEIEQALGTMPGRARL